MIEPKKKSLLLAIVFGAVCLILTALFFSAASILQTDRVQAQVISILRRATGVTFTYKTVRVNILPLPQLTLLDVNFQQVTGKTRGRVDSITLQPELLPLLKGTLRFSQVNLVAPAISIELPTPETPTSPDHAQRLFASFARQLITSAPGLVIIIEDGSLDLPGEKRLSFPLNGFNASLSVSSEHLDVSGTCTAKAWQSLSFSIALHPEEMNGSGSLQVIGLAPAAVPALTGLIPGLQIEAGDADVKSSIEFKGLSQARVSMEGSLTGLNLVRGDRRLKIEDITLQTTLTLDPKQISVQLNEVTLAGLLRRISGTYQHDLATDIRQLTLQAVDIDVSQTRKMVLALGSDQPAITTVFEVLQAGMIPSLTLRSTGNSLAELIDPDHFEITGDLSNGSINIPALDLTFLDVSGNVDISKKVLSASAVKASLNNHHGNQGVLQIGLQGKEAPFHLDMEVDADVGEIPDLLRRLKLPPEGNLRREVDALQDLQGRVIGNLQLGERLDAIKVKLALSVMDFSARSKKIPFPLTITGGKLILDEQVLRMENMTGSLGKSVFKGVTPQVSLKGTYDFKLENGRGVIVLDELYPWLSTLASMKSFFDGVKKTGGVLAVSAAHINGPLLQPKKWRYDFKGEARQCVFDVAFLPSKVEGVTGFFSADQGKLSFERTRAKMEDSNILLSGDLVMFAGSLNKAKITLQGTIDNKLAAWLAKRAGLPQAIKLQGPIGIQEAALSWENDKELTIQGNMTLADGVSVAIDLIKTKAEFFVRALHFKDSQSDATASVSFSKEAIRGNFKGRLIAHSLDAVAKGSPYAGIGLRGDYRFYLPLGHPIESTMEGTVTLSGLPIAWKKDLPLIVKEITLEGVKEKFKIVSSYLLLDGKSYAVHGTVAHANPKVSVDLDVVTEVLDWAVIERLTRENSAGHNSDNFTLEDLPVGGTVRIRTDALHLGAYTWKPFNADISIQNSVIGITSKHSALCGISTSGSFGITADGAKADIVLAAKDIDLEPVTLCLTDKKLDATGTFSMEAHLKGAGPFNKIGDWLNGPITAKASNGKIFRSGIFSKTLKLLNDTDQFEDTMPDLDREAINYKVIVLDGSLQGPIVNLTLGSIVSDFVDMRANGQIGMRDRSLHLKALVTPLRTMGRIVQGTPFVGRILGGNLTAVPITIDGTMNDYKVSFISPSAISSELLGIFKRALKMPVTLVEPAI